MTDFLNVGLIEWGFSLLALSSVAGLSVSCIATALSWAVTSVFKLLHRLF